MLETTAAATTPAPTAAPTTLRTLVSIATYNERGNLEPLVQAIHEVAPQVDILVIDDASPDGTGELADELAQRDRRIKVLHRSGKLGLGTAILAAVQFAIEHDYDYLLNLDADFSHHPRFLPDLLRGMDDHDVMIGSRYVPGGGVIGWNWKRKLMSWGINVYSRMLLGLRARDCSGAYRCYRVSKLKEIPFERIVSRGYSFQEEFLFRCKQVGCRIGETPIVFEDRRVGVSKINVQEIFKALGCLLYTSIRR